MYKLYIALLSLLSFTSYAQEPEISLSGLGIRPISSIHVDDGNFNLSGSIFLDSKWKESKIKMNGFDKIHEYPSKINLKSGMIHVEIRGQEYAIKSSNIDYLIYFDNQKFVFHNKISSLVEIILEKDSVFLYKRLNLKLKKGDYNPALDAGVKNDRWIQEPVYHISLGEELHEVKNKKGLHNFLLEQGLRIKRSSMPNKNNEKQLISLLSKLY
ncbi:hypothetical protein [Ekhidna sp.]|uniref:hypothetical protein n=1 Tax=Ekhidna sp. TaxID=2608089 RepID=UPI003C7C1900